MLNFKLRLTAALSVAHIRLSGTELYFQRNPRASASASASALDSARSNKLLEVKCNSIFMDSVTLSFLRVMREAYVCTFYWRIVISSSL